MATVYRLQSWKPGAFRRPYGCIPPGLYSVGIQILPGELPGDVLQRQSLLEAFEMFPYSLPAMLLHGIDSGIYLTGERFVDDPIRQLGELALRAFALGRGAYPQAFRGMYGTLVVEGKIFHYAFTGGRYRSVSTSLMTLLRLVPGVQTVAYAKGELDGYGLVPAAIAVEIMLRCFTAGVGSIQNQFQK
jgi:hypothetical protein